MKHIRYLLVVLLMLCSAPSHADQLSVRIATPNVSIGFALSNYPDFVLVPGYPVYYAPQLEANLFFYDGEYWLYQDDSWYVSTWYNGPWWLVDPDDVPVFILRVPVRYYRMPPVYFQVWLSNEPPHWGEHWGHEWEQRRSGWNRWNRNVHHRPAPLPDYQRQYSGDRYPRQLEQQRELEQRHYRYQSRDPYLQQRFQQQPVQGGPVMQQRQRAPQEGGAMQQNAPFSRPTPQGAQAVPRATSPQRGGANEQSPIVVTPRQGRTEAQDRKQQTQPETMRREQQMQRPQERETRQQDREIRQQERDSRQQRYEGERDSNRGPGWNQERNRDRQ
ncbi:hypothetical protein [Sideroxydans lithotrophicus]|uniref:Uncharacterized protein n=1 Tax=Sideroxydans lithotrophicus (strain ES-1) TaxID=580332 RepID=D5CPN9_SIDLE|nr:hypothetical protein [Sideroxydans lithotrophicus]ADE13034.1 conserved hypothetical protein [Sideroxydans lithotrophicus ES-1]